MTVSRNSSASVGIDFGTSNTVVAVATPDGAVSSITFPHETLGGAVFMSALCFWDERERGVLTTRMEGGPWAVERFLGATSPHRFIQSFKSFAASAAFTETRIFRERFRFEDLIAAFLRALSRHAGGALDLTAPRVVVGRPVTFAGSRPDDALAMRRYRAGFAMLGAAHAGYAYEPVGAAFSFARSLDHDATVLVADFGGGTSDFSVLRFTAGGTLKAEPLGHAGVGVAGDAFDYRIIDRIVSPRLGKGGSYRSFGKTLPLPTHYYVNFARWHQLATMKGSGELKELRELARFALEPDRLEDFIRIVDEDLGFALYRAVSKTKMALSRDERAAFAFTEGGLDIRAEGQPRRFRALDRAGPRAHRGRAGRGAGARRAARRRHRQGLPHRRHLLRAGDPARLRRALRRRQAHRRRPVRVDRAGAGADRPGAGAGSLDGRLGAPLSG